MLYYSPIWRVTPKATHHDTTLGCLFFLAEVLCSVLRTLLWGRSLGHCHSKAVQVGCNSWPCAVARNTELEMDI